MAHQSQTVLKKEKLDPKLSLFTSSLSNEPAELDAALQNVIDEGYNADPFPNHVLKMLQESVEQSKRISLQECTFLNKLLQHRGMIYIPEYETQNLPILQSDHEALSAPHLCHKNSFELFSRRYYWPKSREYIAQYTKNSMTCWRTKPTTHGKHGVLRPLPSLQEPWQEVSMYFVLELTESQLNNAILVIVDRRSKMCHFIPCVTSVDAEQTGALYLKHV